RRSITSRAAPSRAAPPHCALRLLYCGAMIRPPRILARAQRALADFFRLEASAGLLLIAATALALLCANSPLQDAYMGFRHLPLGARPVEWWINDGLMAVFFLLVSLEIKR